MAVYTHLSFDDIAEFLNGYALGSLQKAEGISSGVENTNYRLVTGPDATLYILTLFEKRTQLEDLPFFMGLMQHLHRHGVICPMPLAAANGEVVLKLKGKPTVITHFLMGSELDLSNVKAGDTWQIGMWLALMHHASASYDPTRPNSLGLAGWKTLFQKVESGLDQFRPGLRHAVGEEIDYLSSHWPGDLPAGIIHADLFPDNVFFNNDILSGVIDFYFACHDFWLYDVAIAINAWCFHPNGMFLRELAEALLAGYASKRAISEKERAVLNVLLRGAAMRFLLTRAHDALFPIQGAQVTAKDPLEYFHKLCFFQTQAWQP